MKVKGWSVGGSLWILAFGAGWGHASARLDLYRHGVLRVVAESAYPTIAPGARVRVAAHAPFLRDHDVDLEFRSHISSEEYLSMARAGGHIGKVRITGRCVRRVLQRPDPRDALAMVHKLLGIVPVPGHDPPTRVDVYDLDDALFHGSTSTQNRAFASLKRERQRCHAYLRTARLVLAGNEYLASYARSHARRVEVVPSCVDPLVQSVRRHENVEVLVVGWLGSGTTTAYLAEILPVFAAINRTGVRMKLLTVGADRLPEAPWLEQHVWQLGSEAQMLTRFDVGIMPLPDNPWSRGKCGYKLLRYFAAGVPAIASPVGVNRTLIERGCGLSATSPRDWRSALEELARDVGARREAGAAGRLLVEREYSYQRWAPELAGILHSV